METGEVKTDFQNQILKSKKIKTEYENQKKYLIP